MKNECSVPLNPLQITQTGGEHPNNSKCKRHCIICLVIVIILAALILGLVLGLLYFKTDSEFSDAKFFIDENDLQIFSFEGVEVYGIKDFFGNIQSIYAIKYQNINILLQNQKISIIQWENESLVFQYQQSYYNILYLIGEYSKELIKYANFNISFPKITYSDSIKETQFENPFKGVIITIKDSRNKNRIPQGVVEVTYVDERTGSRCVILPIIGRGKYFLSLPQNYSQNTNDEQIDNFKSSLKNQLNSIIDLLSKYMISDICSSVPSSSNLCIHLNKYFIKINSIFFKILQINVLLIPIEKKSIHKYFDFSAKVNVPGEKEEFLRIIDFDFFRSNSLIERTYEIETEQGVCSDVTVHGNNLPDTRIINIGKSTGRINFSYNNYYKKDQINVYYEKKLIFSTGCVNGIGFKQLEIIGKETNLQITVAPNCEGGTGTIWDYVVYCDENLLICEENFCKCYVGGKLIQIRDIKSNGCGSSQTHMESTYKHIYDTGDLWGFTDSCNAHNLCYGTCGMNKSQCDEFFLNDIRENCEKYKNLSNKKIYQNCQSFAEVLYQTVFRTREEEFINSQKENCKCSE